VSIMDPATWPDLTLRRLLCFDAVATHGSYAGAALRLSIPTATVWRQVKQLEDELGLALLVPGQRGAPARLTEAGRVIHNRAKDVIASSQALVEIALLASEGRARPLQLGGYPAHTALCFAPLVAQLADQKVYADIGRSDDGDRLNEGERLVRDLGHEVFDLVVAPPRGGFDSERLVAEPLYRWNLVAVVDHYPRLRDQDAVNIRELQGIGLLISPDGHESHRMLFELADKSLTDLTVRHENSSVETLLAMGRHRLGLPVLPADALASFPSVKQVRPITDRDDEPTGDSFFMYYRTDEEDRDDLVLARQMAHSIMRSTSLPGVSPI